MKVLLIYLFTQHILRAMLNTYYVLSGSNIGDCRQHLKHALILIQKQIGKIIKVSSVYKTAPWGNTDQSDFYNQAIEGSTNLNPRELLNELLNIEKMMGRERNKRWESRIIDLDILYYENLIIAEEQLSVPHPHLHQRLFALVPLCEISPDFIHPVLCQTNRQLLNTCEDDLIVEKL